MLNFNRRFLSVLFLGFSSGLPLALTGATLQAWFTQAGLSVVTIGILSLVGIPYVWKFLWAPLMDRFSLPWGGRRRGWIALTQVMLCLTLFLMANLNPSQNPLFIGILAFIISFISASQDIAIDAYRTDVLLPEERGLAVAAYIFTYRIAMLVSGGVALMMADRIGWQVTYEIMAVLMLLCVVTTYFSPEIHSNVKAPTTIISAIVEPIKNLWQRDSIILLLLFIMLYKFGDAFAQTLMSNFLLRGLGFSLTDVGVIYKTVGLFATILGAFAGGSLLVRWNIFNALMYFGLAQAFSNLMFVILAMAGKNYWLMASSIFIESFCSGMSTAALFAFLTGICDTRYSAMQYASLSAMALVGRTFLGPVAGVIVENLGWINFYIWAFLMSFPGLFLLGILRNKVRTYAEAVE